MEKGKVSYSKEELVTILLEHDLLMQSDKVCSQQPSNISASMSFVVDMDMLEDAKDLAADDMGSYRLHGSPPEYVYVLFKNNQVQRVVCNRQCKLTADKVERLQLDDAEIFILERKYGTCKASLDLRRMTTKLKIADDKRSGHFLTHKYCLVQYTFNEGDHEVNVGAHGNAKTSKPFKKTKESVKKNLQNTLQQTNMTPGRALSQLKSSNGGYMLTTSSSDLCRNRKQAWNMNQKVELCISSLWKEG